MDSSTAGFDVEMDSYAGAWFDSAGPSGLRAERIIALLVVLLYCAVRSRRLARRYGPRPRYAAVMRWLLLLHTAVSLTSRRALEFSCCAESQAFLDKGSKSPQPQPTGMCACFTVAYYQPVSNCASLSVCLRRTRTE
jgi:hypothetical protein